MEKSEQQRSWLRTVAGAVWNYIKDWRNLVSHMALGWVLLALAIWLPVDWWMRLAVILALIALNTLRMRRRSARLAAAAAEQSEQ